MVVTEDEEEKEKEEDEDEQEEQHNLIKLTEMEPIADRPYEPIADRPYKPFLEIAFSTLRLSFVYLIRKN